jgi:hypothetical protein
VLKPNSLINSGLIDADGAGGTTINTGSATIANFGTLEATASGGMLVQSAVDNKGQLISNGGNLTLQGVVTGHGTATIGANSTMEFGAASSANVAFSALSGVLQLDQSQSFTGSIAGFGGQDQIDLSDIAFGANTTLGYAADSGNSGGTLTVSDGTHVVNIALLGQYMTSSFATASDGHGGTLISDPPPSQQLQLAQPH